MRVSTFYADEQDQKKVEAGMFRMFSALWDPDTGDAFRDELLDSNKSLADLHETLTRTTGLDSNSDIAVVLVDGKTGASVVKTSDDSFSSDAEFYDSDAEFYILILPERPVKKEDENARFAIATEALRDATYFAGKMTLGM